MTLRLEGADGAPRAWTREFEGGPAPALPAIEALLLGPGGHPVGVLRVEPANRTPVRMGAEDQAILGLLASQASWALAR